MTRVAFPLDMIEVAGGKEREEIVQEVLAQIASVAIGPVDSLSIHSSPD